jgi:protein TonB
VTWALATGLGQVIVKSAVAILNAEVVPEKVLPKAPPPPPPDLKAPPPVFVPAPDVVISVEAAPSTITTSAKPTVLHLESYPASIGRPHTCMQNYPPISQRLGEEGTTLLAFTITADGGVSNITVAKSSGSERLDSAAASCAANWRYKAAIDKGQPVAVPWKAEVRWVLH